MTELVPVEASYWCDVGQEIRFGKVAEEIRRMADDIEADLVVIGIGGIDGSPDSLPGTTALDVLSTASCPVLLVQGENALTAGVPTHEYSLVRARLNLKGDY